MDIRYDHRALTDRRCNTFHGFGSYVTDSVDTGNTSRVRSGFKAPTTTGESKPFFIELDGAIYPP